MCSFLYLYHTLKEIKSIGFEVRLSVFNYASASIHYGNHLISLSLIFLICKMRTKECILHRAVGVGGYTSSLHRRMAEEISLEKGAISSQHTELVDGRPTKVELWAPGWLGEYLKSTQDEHSRRDSVSLPDGCSSHNTAMAVAALGGFLYVLAQYPPANRELQQATMTPPTATHVDGSVPATPGR